MFTEALTIRSVTSIGGVGFEPLWPLLLLLLCISICLCLWLYGQWVVRSIPPGGLLAISHSTQCSKTGLTKAVVYTILSVNIKENICVAHLIGVAHEEAAEVVHLSLSEWLLTNVQHHITTNKMC